MSQQPAPSDAHADQYTRMAIVGVLILLFAISSLLPFWNPVPEGRTGDMIASGQKTIETVVVFVLGYYFSANKESSRKTDALIAASVSGGLGSSAEDGSTVTRAPPGSQTTVTPVAPPALEEPEVDAAPRDEETPGEIPESKKSSIT